MVDFQFFNFITFDAEYFLQSVLLKPNLIELSLYNCKFSKDSFGIVIYFLEVMPFDLRKLNMVGMQLWGATSDEDVEDRKKKFVDIGNAINNLRVLRELNFSYNKKIQTLLKSIIANNKTLHALKMSGCGLKDVFLEETLESLKNFKSLHALDLSHNKLTDTGIILLSGVFQS